MSEQYTQTLIAVPKGFVPSGEQIEAFLKAMVEQGVVPEAPTIVVRTPSGKTSQIKNPFTGKMDVFEGKHHQDLADLGQVTEAVGDRPDFEIEVAGQGMPKMAPLPVKADGPYHVGVTCRVSSVLRSTSHVVNDMPGVAHYRKPSFETATMGYFSDPETLAVIEVPNGGCARFWIEFELGKFLYPTLNGRLNVLNPVIVKEAVQRFGIEFVQGCYWG